MTRLNAVLLTLVSVLLIASGQVLFKISANRAIGLDSASFIDRWLSPPLLAALLMYLLATALWVWVLQHSRLSALYPLFALAFLMVPVMAHFVLNEPLSMRHFIGGALIVAGIAVSANA